jgi:hypothetical protein
MVLPTGLAEDQKLTVVERMLRVERELESSCPSGSVCSRPCDEHSRLALAGALALRPGGGIS